MRLFIWILALGVVLTVAVPTGALALTTLSWQTEPIMGNNISFTQSPGDVFVQTGPGPTDGVTIPHYSILGDPLYGVGGPGISTFWINPTVWDGVSHFYDPNVNVFSGSGVYLDSAASYHYTGIYDFLGTLGNPAYSVTAAEDTSFSEESGFIMLTTGIGAFWPEDVGNWNYTETWTNNALSTDTITSTRDFTVALGPEPLAVPEPVTMLGLLLSVGSVAGYLRRRRMAA